MLKISPTKEALKCHLNYVSKVFNKLIRDEYIIRDKKQKKIEKRFILFLDKYKDELINAEPKRLLEINSEFEKKNFSKHQLKFIKSFFLETGYKNFPNKKFLNHLNIDTCIYCNKNYTLYFDGNFARAELDHWFPKEKFPLLALSFYNLIPSCHSCNHKKGNGDKIIKSKFLNNENAKEIEIQNWWNNEALTKLIHPYFDKIDFSFSYNVESLNTYSSKIKVKRNSRSENTIKFNKTKEIYEVQSSKELKDLCDLRLKYSKNYLDILCNKTFKGLNLSQEEAYRMIFGIEINADDYHKRPFSKFKHDIIEELKKGF